MTDTTLADKLRERLSLSWPVVPVTLEHDELATLIAALEMVGRVREAEVLEGGDTPATFVRWNTAMRMHEGQRVALLALPIDTTSAGA